MIASIKPLFSLLDCDILTIHKEKALLDEERFQYLPKPGDRCPASVFDCIDGLLQSHRLSGRRVLYSGPATDKTMAKLSGKQRDAQTFALTLPLIFKVRITLLG